MCSPGTATTTTTTTTTTEAGSGCQQPGNTLYYMSEYDIPVGDPCCAGSMCLPWFGEYGKAVDNFCQLSNPIQEGKFCGVSTLYNTTEILTKFNRLEQGWPV